MKQEATKKSKLWIWLVVGIVALLAVVGVVLGIVLAPGSSGDEVVDEGPKGGRPEIYWNVDRQDYLEADTGMSTREPGEDGNFYITFAFEGEQVELPILDKQLVNYIDSMDVMGLVMDESGMVIDAVDVNTIATEIAKGFVIQSIDGDMITLDSSVALNGMEIVVNRCELTKFYNITDSVDFKGQEIEMTDLLPMDFVTVYGNDMGQATHFVIIEHPVDSPVYWRTAQFYNSTAKETTRVPDENGVYTIEFFVNGERVELKCKDKALVTAIDKPNKFSCHTGLIFDEEGYIIDTQSSFVGIRGKLGCTLYETIEVNGTTFTAQRQIAGGTEVGQTYTNTWDENTEIYDVSFYPVEEERGKLTESLQVGDRLVVFEDSTGKPVVIFVTHRLCDSPMYFNVTKSYSSATKETTRKPNASGWYTIELMVEGEIKTFRTKNKDLMTQIDKQSSRSVGLRVDGDEILQVWGHEHVCGYGSNVGYYVDSITSIVMTVINSTGTSSKTSIMNANCKVYNMSGIGGELGSTTTPQVGDYCIILNNPSGEAVYVYILQRYVENADVYYLLDGRKYSSTTQATTRVPDDNGYYVYKMASNGKQVTVKTRSKAMATKIDKSGTYNIIALEVSGGIVQNAYTASAATGGQRKAAGYYVRGWQDDGTLLVYSKSSSATINMTFAEDCKFYNVSADYNDFRGEQISRNSIKADDQILGLTDRSGKVVQFYVYGRDFYAPFCWHVNRQYDSVKKVTTRKPDENGYYVFELVYDGEIKTLKTKDIDIATDVDSRSAAFSVRDKNGIIKGVLGPLDVNNIDAAGEINSKEVISVKGNKLTVKDGEGTKTVTLHPKYKAYDMSGTGEYYGQLTKIQPGDRMRTYMDKDKLYTHLIVQSRYFPRVKGDVGMCEHCGKEVQWTSWGGGSLPASDGHYYLSTNVKNAAQATVGSSKAGVFDIVVDLNGKTLDCSKRAFLVWYNSSLNIIDSVGGGKIVGRAEPSTAGDQGGVIRIAAGGIVNLYSGTLAMAEDANPAQRGGVICVNGSTCEFHMFGGTVENGVATYNANGKDPQGGGNIFVNGGVLEITGGKVTGGKVTAGAFGENVYNYNGKVSIADGTVDGGIVNYGQEPEVEKPILDLNGVYEAAKAMTFAADGETHKCPVCDKDVVWNALPVANGEEKVALADGHYYVAENLEITKYYEIAGQVCINLNGKTISSTDSVFSTLGGSVTAIMGEGTVTGNTEAKSVEATVLNKGTMYLCGGTYARSAAALTSSTVTQHGTMYVYDGTLFDGASYGLRCTSGTTYLCGGANTATATIRVAGDKANATITGAPKYEALQIATNKLEVGKLTEGAQINITVHPADGILTEALSDAEAVKGYFTTSIAGKKIDVVNGAIAVVNASTEPDEPDVPVEPELPEYPLNKIDNSSISEKFAEGTTTALCPVCEQEVEWIALEAITETKELENGKHYYLAGDLENAASYKVPAGVKDAPVEVTIHLNGHNITSSTQVLTTGVRANTYILGEGTVCGAATTGNAATLALTSNTYLLGGTYTHVGTLPTATLLRADDSINVYAGAEFVATEGATGAHINVPYGAFNMYGGSIAGGTAVAGDKTDGKGGNVCVGVNTINTVSGKTQHHFNMYGGFIDGDVFVNFPATSSNTFGFTVEGNSVIAKTNGGLTIADGKLLTVGQLGAEAEIYVTAVDVFTTELANVKAAAKAVKAAQAGYEVVAEGNTLAYAEKLDPNDTFEKANAMDFSDAQNLPTTCPFCNETVTWTALPASNGETNVELADGHYYAAESLANTRPYGVSGKVCVHLNGKDITSESWVFMPTASADLTIMGTGVVTGGSDTNGAVMTLTGTLNLCGGTFRKTTSTHVFMNPTTAKNAVINVYDGTVVEGSGAMKENTFRVTADGTQLNIFGGELKGTATRSALNAQITVSGAPVIEFLQVAGNNKLIVGELTEGAAINVAEAKADGIVTVALADAEAVKGYFTTSIADKEIGVAGGAIVIVDKATEPEEPTPEDPKPEDPKPEDPKPEEPVLTGYNAVYAAAKEMNFADAAAMPTTCPFCDTTVTWQALPAAGELAAGHYYLATDVELASEDDLYTAKEGAVCINLNGKTISAPKSIFKAEKTATLTIMGEGTVHGAKTAKGSVVYALGPVNLCGGTYTHTVAGTSTFLTAVDNSGIYHGTVFTLAEGVTGNHVRNTSGLMTIAGGEFLNTEVRLSSKGAAVISGAPKIAKLQVQKDTDVITVGELTEGAQINVTLVPDSGVFTTEFASEEAAKAAAAYFTTTITETVDEVVVEKAVGVVGKTLAIVDKPAEPAEPVLPTTCPVCAATELTWTALPAAGELATGHYAVEADLENAAPYTIAADAVVCVHLNGKTLSSTGMVFDVTVGTLNIIGEGTVIGAEATDAADTASTIKVSGTGAVNLAGGTIKHAATSQNPSVVHAGGNLNIYEGTVLTADEGTLGGNLYISKGTTKMYGGVISNGVAVKNKTTGCAWGGNVLIRGLKTNASGLYMYGGEIFGGVAEYGGNIGIPGHFGGTGNLTLRLYGGKIYNGTANSTKGGMGGNIYAYQTKNRVIMRIEELLENDGVALKGVEIYGGKANYGGNIAMRYTKPTDGTTVTAPYFMIRGAKIYGGVATKLEDKAGVGGNVYLSGPFTATIGMKEENNATTGTVITYQPTTITGGQAVNGGNVYAGVSALKVEEGATFSEGVASENGAEIWLGSSAKYTCTGVVDAEKVYTEVAAQ